MSERPQWLRASGRAVVGLAITVAAVGAVVAVGTITLPAISRGAVAMTVDTSQGAGRDLSCAGPFMELGVDPSRPGASMPTGAAELSIAGEPGESRTLTTEAGDNAATVVTAASADELLAAAQVQRIDTESLAGIAASACGEPANEQWLVGGDTRLGTSTTLTVGNPGDVAATVRISLFDEAGPVDEVQSAGVLVPAGSQRTVSLNGYAPDRAQLAARVLSTGAAVTATLGVAQTRDITPVGVDTVMAQFSPSQMLAFPGVTRTSDDAQTATDAHDMDEFPVTVRVLAPGATDGTVEIRAVDADGSSTVVGQTTLTAGVVSETVIEHWDAAFGGLVVTADVPVIGGVRGTAVVGRAHDLVWFSPAGVINAGETIAVPIVDAPGVSMTLLNTGTTEAEVAVSRPPDAGLLGLAKPTLVRVPAGAAIEVPVERGRALTLVSDAPIHASVTMVEGPGIAAYAIEPPRERAGTLTVYPR